MTTHKTNFQAIGTHWSILVNDHLSKTDWDSLLARVHQRIEEFDRAYSRFRPDSLVTKMSKVSGKYDLPDDGCQLLKFYKQLYDATGGKVTPLIGRAISDSGYDADYSFKASNPKSPPEWGSVLKYSQNQIETKQPVLLDFGAAGKGYLVDIVAGLLDAAGLKDYVIDASGDIRHRGPRPIEIGLEDPLDASQAVGMVEVVNKSLCASSHARRRWGKYTHILDPRSLKSPTDILATWVIADDAMTADGLATALFFVKPIALEQFNFSYAVLYKGMSLKHSSDFPVKIFRAESDEAD